METKVDILSRVKKFPKFFAADLRRKLQNRHPAVLENGGVGLVHVLNQMSDEQVIEQYLQNGVRR